MPIVLKSGNLNLLEASGPVQACNGIALPFYRVQTVIMLVVLHVCETEKLISEKILIFMSVNTTQESTATIKQVT